MVDFTEERDDRRPAWRLVRLTFIVSLASFVFGAVFVDQMLTRGFSPASMGVAFFIAFLLATVVEIFSGDWGDRYGTRLMTVTGLALWAAGLILFSSAMSVLTLILSLACWSIGQAVYSGAPISLTVNAIPAERSDLRAAAVRWGEVSRWAGSALGGVVVLLSASPARTQLLIAASGTVLLLAAGFVQLRWAEQTSRTSPCQSNIVSRFRDAWRPELSSLLLVCATCSGLLSVFLFAWQPVSRAVLGVEERQLGLVLLLLMAVAALGSGLARFQLVRMTRGNLDLWVLLAVIAGLLSLVGSSWMPTGAALAGVELLTSYVMTVAATRTHGLLPDDARNLLWSVFGAAMGIAMSLSDLIFGIAWQRLGLGSAIIVCVLVLGVSIILGRTAVWWFGRSRGHPAIASTS